MKRRRNVPKLAAEEIRVVAYSRGEEVSQTFKLEGRPAGARDLRAVLEGALLGFSMRAEDRPQSGMPEYERKLWLAAGFDDKPPNGLSATELGRLEYIRILTTSYDVAAAARLLKVNTSRIRQRLIAGELYGIKDGKRWLLPRFQFLGNRLVPGIERVNPRIPRNLDPVAAIQWFYVPNPDLGVGEDEEPTTPLDWLTGGRDPDPVAELAGDYGW